LRMASVVAPFGAVRLKELVRNKQLNCIAPTGLPTSFTGPNRDCTRVRVGCCAVLAECGPCPCLVPCPSPSLTLDPGPSCTLPCATYKLPIRGTGLRRGQDAGFVPRRAGGDQEDAPLVPPTTGAARSTKRAGNKKSVWFILLISFAYLHVLRARMGVHRAS